MAALKASGSGTARSRSLAFSQTARERGCGSKAVVLLTGFGPFPGVERNASAELAFLLARMGAERHGHVRFVANLLPVDWRAAPLRISELVRQHRPAVALNFGVSARASGFVIEAHAYNETKDIPDDSGKCAGSFELISGERPRRSATLPVRRIVRELQRAGFPAELSSDPGRYLCNAVLYHALRHATRATPRMRTGFIHIPASLEPGVSGTTSELGWPDALEGGLRLLDTCLTPLRLRDRVLF
jgi:pyroglutamyl-peptidase